MIINKFNNFSHNLNNVENRNQLKYYRDSSLVFFGKVCFINKNKVTIEKHINVKNVFRQIFNMLVFVYETDILMIQLKSH